MLVCLLVAAGEGPGFDPACAECYVAICGVPVETFPGFLSTVFGADVWVAVEIVYVWVAVDVAVEIVDVWVAVVVVVESCEPIPLLSVCTAAEEDAEEDATGCRSTKPLDTTGPAADTVFAAALLGSARTGPPGSCFALLLLSASVEAERERLVPAVCRSLLSQHCFHRYV